MVLKIEQSLLQAVEAHKAGKLQDAEALYRAILQSEPKQPDANHNLGVLAVSVRQHEAALPLFKTALEANPSQSQFWLSYIQALIYLNQLDNAQDVLNQGKNLGLAGDKVDALNAQLKAILSAQATASSSTHEKLTLTQQRKNASENKKKSTSKQSNLSLISSPSQLEISSLLEYYQTGQYNLAETLAKEITQKYPNHQFAWKVLGALFKQTGRLEESLTANHKAVKLFPNDSESHYNLGITLHELGRLEEAERSYKKAIAITPGYAETHYNLGITLQKLGRLAEAEKSYKKAIAIKNEYAEAHYNLGITLQELVRLEEAEKSYKKAIAIKYDYAEAHSNLGITLQELGRLEEAEISLKNAMVHKPDFSEALLNFALLCILNNEINESIRYLIKVMETDEHIFKIKAAVTLSIISFLKNDLIQTEILLNNSKIIIGNNSKILINDAKYYFFMCRLLSWHRENTKILNNYNGTVVHVIGESHSLSSHGVEFKNLTISLLFKAHWIEGCKQWHLGNNRPNKYKEKFKRVIQSIADGSKILLAIGEIDCRLEEGIIKQVRKSPQKSQTDLIESTVDNYLTYVNMLTKPKLMNVIIQGIPCPNIDLINFNTIDLLTLINLIKEFNDVLHFKSQQFNFEFLDLHKLTDRGDGFSNGIWNIDRHHLSPAGMIEAWKRHFG